MNALGLVTAAGKSTRMGGFPKPLLFFDGERFAERILRSYAEAGVEHRLVVLGHEADVVRERVDFDGAATTVNGAYETGMLSSVRIGVRHARKRDVDAMFLWPTDYPCVPSVVLDRLWERFRETRADVVLPNCGTERGHPALFGSTTFRALLDAPETEGARAVVYDDDTTVIDVPVDDERVLVDVDTPAEYWEAVKRYGGTGSDAR